MFVYGTLMPGEPAAGRLRILSSAPAKLPGHALYDSGLGWPLAAPSPDPAASAEVHGFVLELAGEDDEVALEEADAWEDAGTLYDRARVNVVTATDTIEAWAYVSDPERLARLAAGARPIAIPSGRWSPLAQGTGGGGAAGAG